MGYYIARTVRQPFDGVIAEAIDRLLSPAVAEVAA